jgi:hypothetical protein
MAQTVFYKSNQAVVDPVDGNLPVRTDLFFLQNPAVFGLFRHQSANGTDCQLHDLDILLLVMASYVIDLPCPSLMDHQVDSLAVVFHVQPVAYICPVTINRKRFTFENVFNNQRYQLFREMVRTIIVGTTGDADRHLISFGVSLYKQVGTRLGCTVRTTWVQWSRFMEIAFGPQATIHLIGRHLVETDTLTPFRITGSRFARHPRFTSRIEQILST